MPPVPEPIDLSIGPYTITREIGRGGMGVVYLGRDSRLDRDVAIKALPEHLAQDPDRLARFEREAKTLAQLNHPNVAGIYGVEEHEAARYLVLEYVQGETLAARLDHGALPVDEALEIAVQIAAGMEAAHDTGVIHRDLKPGNVIVTPDGRAKVLDFGLARMQEASSSTGASPTDATVTSPAKHAPTMPGVILGTAAYMSPEQARGRALDKRTDIWSFGVILFECLSGRRPFTAATTADLVAQILERDPDWNALPPATPPLIQLLLRRCLAKDKRRRLRDIGDACVDIETALNDPTTSGVLLTREALTTSSRRRWWFVPLTLVLAIGVLLGVGISPSVRLREPATRSPALHFTVDIPPSTKLRWEEWGTALSLSPDGTMLAFVAEARGKAQLFIHDLSRGETRPVSAARGGRSPFFSPGGLWLAFIKGNRLMKVSVLGGPPQVVCDAGRSGATWLDDGTIVFGGDRLHRVDAKGGTPQVLATGGPAVWTEDGEQRVGDFIQLEAVPGASYVLGGVWGGKKFEAHGIVSISLGDGALRSVVRNAVHPSYVPPGYLVFLRESSLLAAPFDAKRGVITGEEIPVIDGVLTAQEAQRGQFAISASGTLAYVPGARRGSGRRLIRVTPDGKSTPVMDDTEAIYGSIRVSPDGREVALVTVRRQLELWTFDLGRGSMKLIDVGDIYSPVWTHDGEALLYQKYPPEQEGKIYLKQTDAAEPAVPLPIGRNQEDTAASFSPDGKLLLLSTWPAADILLHHWGEEGETEVLLGTPAVEVEPRFAPDGEHFAYVSNETGPGEVFVSAISNPGWKQQVSRDGGWQPVWSRDGRYLFFLGDDGVLYRATIETDPTFDISLPEPLFDTAGILATEAWGGYDVLPDGDFVMVEPAEWEKRPVRIHVVINWASTLGKDSNP